MARCEYGTCNKFWQVVVIAHTPPADLKPQVRKALQSLGCDDDPTDVFSYMCCTLKKIIAEDECEHCSCRACTAECEVEVAARNMPMEFQASSHVPNCFFKTPPYLWHETESNITIGAFRSLIEQIATYSCISPSTSFATDEDLQMFRDARGAQAALCGHNTGNTLMMKFKAFAHGGEDVHHTIFRDIDSVVFVHARDPFDADDDVGYLFNVSKSTLTKCENGDVMLNRVNALDALEYFCFLAYLELRTRNPFDVKLWSSHVTVDRDMLLVQCKAYLRKRFFGETRKLRHEKESSAKALHLAMSATLKGRSISAATIKKHATAVSCGKDDDAPLLKLREAAARRFHCLNRNDYLQNTFNAVLTILIELGYGKQR
jgi:hypothetical protein